MPREKSIIEWIEILLTDEYYSDCPIESTEIVGDDSIEISLDRSERFDEIRKKEGRRFRLSLIRMD